MRQEESICTRKIHDIYNTYRMKLCQNDHTESQWLLTTKCHTQIKNTFYSIDLICIFIGEKRIQHMMLTGICTSHKVNKRENKLPKC